MIGASNDKLRTGFDRALLSKVEGLRVNGCNCHAAFRTPVAGAGCTVQ